jgi:hypothetical protein
MAVAFFATTTINAKGLSRLSFIVVVNSIAPHNLPTGHVREISVS